MTPQKFFELVSTIADGYVLECMMHDEVVTLQKISAKTPYEYLGSYPQISNTIFPILLNNCVKGWEFSNDRKDYRGYLYSYYIFTVAEAGICYNRYNGFQGLAVYNYSYDLKDYFLST